MDVERIKELLYDLEKHRRNPQKVHELVMAYQHTKGYDKLNFNGVEYLIELSDVDHNDEEVRIYVEVAGESDSIWIPVPHDVLQTLSHNMGCILGSGVLR